MYRQVFIPSKKTHTIAIPREWYGQEIEITVSPTQQCSAPPCRFTVEEARELVRQAAEDTDPSHWHTHEEVMQRMDEHLAHLKQRQHHLEEEYAL